MNETVKSDTTSFPFSQELMSRLEAATEDVSDYITSTDYDKYCYSSVAPQFSFSCLNTEGSMQENKAKLSLSACQKACVRGEDSVDDVEPLQGGTISFDFEDEGNGEGGNGGEKTFGGEENHLGVLREEKNSGSSPPEKSLPPFATTPSRCRTPPDANTDHQIEIDGVPPQQGNKNVSHLLRGDKNMFQPFSSPSSSPDHSPPPYTNAPPPTPSVTERSSLVDVYEALQSEPFFATRLDFRSFHSLQRGTGSRSRGSSSNTLSNELSVGLFIGQLPSSYLTDDIVAVLHTLSSQAGQQVQIRSVKSHGSGHTCAFVMVNSNALPALLGFNKRVVCDLNSLWLVDESKIPYLRFFLEETASRHIMRSCVPRAALVLEKLVEQPRPPSFDHRKTKKPAASRNTSSSSFPMSRNRPAFSSSSFTTASSLDDVSGRVGNHSLPQHHCDVSGNPSNGSFSPPSHSLPGSSSFSSSASCSTSSTVPNLSHPSCRVSNPSLGRQHVSVMSALPLQPRAAGREGSGFPPFFGGEPLIAGNPWSPMANTTFFYPTPSVASSLLPTPGGSSSNIMMTMPLPPPPPPPPPSSAPFAFSQDR